MFFKLLISTLCNPLLAQFKQLGFFFQLLKFLAIKFCNPQVLGHFDNFPSFLPPPFCNPPSPIHVQTFWQICRYLVVIVRSNLGIGTFQVQTLIILIKFFKNSTIGLIQVHHLDFLIVYKICQVIFVLTIAFGFLFFL